MMKKLIKTILFSYGFVFSYLLFLSGIRNFRSFPDLILALILSPVIVYFLLSVFKQLKFFRKSRSKIEITLKQLKIISLVNTLLLFFIAVYGSIFQFEFVFIMMILPLPLYFILLNFEKDEKKSHSVEKIADDKETEKQIDESKKVVLKKIVKSKDDIKLEKAGVHEPLRRHFIKLIGGTGIGFLIASLINPRKAEASFFGSVPGPGTVALKDTNNVKIDPAIKSPTDAYGISQVADTVPAYYGFVNKDGAWYITREEDDGSYRYSKGLLDFAANWLNRGGLTYSYFNTAFSS